MPSDWISPCGIPYRVFPDGRIEVQGMGFPSYEGSAQVASQISAIWNKWGAYVVKGAQQSGLPQAWVLALIYIESGGKTGSTAPCTEKLCPALWKTGGCASTNVCAGGLVGFIASTAKMYGHDLSWYFIDGAHEGQMVVDGADLLKQKIAAKGGDVLAGVKSYNGGRTCSDTGLATGPGLVGMYGQGDYVSKFIKVANSFVALGLAPQAASMGGTAGNVLALLALGGVTWWLLESTGAGKRIVSGLRL